MREAANLELMGVYRAVIRAVHYDSVWDRMERIWPQLFDAGEARRIEVLLQATGARGTATTIKDASSTAATMTPGNRLAGLDTLRAWAITWVVLAHLDEHHFVDASPAAVRLICSHGSAGVDVFFVLSGFLIGRILYRELERAGGIGLRNFWWRRWMRTLPAYYATLALVALGGVVIPRHTPWEHPWAYLIFLQNYLSIGSSFNWSWSLCVEEQFYLALPLLLIGARKLFPGARAVTLVRIVALAAFGVTLSARVHAGATADLSDWDKYMRELYAVTHCRLDGLAIGLFAATLPAFSLQWATAGALLVGGFTCWTAMMLGLGWRPLTENLFATAGTGALVLALLGRPSWMAARFPGAAFVSELSYGLYLLQPVAFEVTMRALPSTVPSLVRAFAAIAASVVSAYAMRRGLELPALRLRDRLFIEEPVGATTGG